MGTLILIRHGRTPANEQGILAGRSAGVSLDEVGKSSALELQKKFADLEVKYVAASPLTRTVETAEIVFPQQKIDLIEDLIECEYGDWTGKKLSDLTKEPLWETIQKAPQQVTFPNGESMQQMSDRSVQAIKQKDAQLRELHGKDFIWAAVSHGDIIKAIIADALGLDLAKFQRIYVEPASISVLRFFEDDSAVVKVNDTGDSWISKLAELAKPTLGGQTGSSEVK